METRSMRDARHDQPNVERGDQIIFIYEDDAELLAFLIPFVKHGLANNEPCVCIFAAPLARKVTAALSASEGRVAQQTKRDAFAIMGEGGFFKPAFSDASNAIAQLRARLEEAIAAGFTGLRVAIDAAAIDLDPGRVEEEYEQFHDLLEKTTAPRRLTVAGILREDHFEPVFLERLVRTHPKVFARNYVALRLGGALRGLDRTDIQGLSEPAHERHVRGKQLFFRQGDRASEVFFLTAGRVKLVRTDEQGRGVILRIVAPTDWFGERVLAIGGTVRYASAEALEDSRALVWDGSALVQAILTHPKVSRTTLGLLAEAIEAEQARVQDFVSPDVGRRLARLLVRLSQHLGCNTRQRPRDTPRDMMSVIEVV